MSVTGVVYLAMMLFMGAAAVNSQANLLFGVLGLMIGIGFVTYSINRLVLRRLAVTRALPEHGVVGRHCVYTYEVTNNKRYWPSFSVTVAELDGADAFLRQPQGYLLHCAARMTAVVPCEVVPRRRGLHQLERYQIATSFPFGFIKRAETRKHRDAILIYPALAEVSPRVLSLARSAENTGAHMRPRRGGNDEFYGVKEYRAGESPRGIYWRRSARTGTLVSKEMTHVSPPKIDILLDTFVPDDSNEACAAAERAIAMAASLASLALEAGMPVGLSVWSGDELIRADPTRGKRQRRDLLTILARLPVNRTHGVDALVGNSEAHRKSGTTTYLVTPRNITMTLGEAARGGTIILSPASEQARAWFTFDPAVEFATCAPVEEKKGSGMKRTKVT
jgi:uncharacterized protein (DUF58 family)